MILEAEQMAHNLNLIITDAGELLGEMAAGNYAVGKSKINMSENLFFKRCHEKDERR